MRWLLPKSLAGQTILVLLIGLTFSHILSMAIYSSDRAEVLMVSSDQQMAHRIAEIARLLKESPPEWRERIVQVLAVWKRFRSDDGSVFATDPAGQSDVRDFGGRDRLSGRERAL